MIEPGIGLLFWMTLTFLILLFILGKFGWPVMTKMINERETLIQKSLDEAQKARAEMEQLKYNNDVLLKQTMEERDDILKEARLLGESLKEEFSKSKGRISITVFLPVKNAFLFFNIDAPEEEA